MNKTEKLLAEVLLENNSGYECLTASNRKSSEGLIEAAYTFGRINGMISEHDLGDKQ